MFRLSINQTFFPKPVQNPHPPILVGGNSKAAIKRSVIYGDAWFPINISPTEVKKGRDQIHKYCRENNINSDNKSIYLHLPLNLGDKKYDSNNERLHFSGEIKEIKEDIKKYKLLLLFQKAKIEFRCEKLFTFFILDTLFFTSSAIILIIEHPGVVRVISIFISKLLLFSKIFIS